MRLATSLLLGLIFTAQAFAADAPRVQTVPAPASEPPGVPGGDIFGFTSPTDVGSPGDRGVAFESSHRAGRREGRYYSGTLKTQLGFTLTENLAVAVSPFVTWHRIRDSAVFADVSRTAFDGLSGELSWRFLPRTESGIAATFSMEPRWARVDSLSGQRVDAFSTEFKLFVDAVLIPNTLYGALNLNWAPGTSRSREFGIGPWETSSGTNISLALAYQINENLFVGAEARVLSAFDGAFLNRNTGNALFVGPTALVRINERVAINAVWTPQVVGASRPSNGRLDLDNFERHQFRIKTSIAF